MKNLIDRDEILDILDERFGFWDFVRDLINKYDLDDHEDAVLMVADDILEGIRNFVESAEVVEKQETELFISYHTEDYGDYSRPYYLYTCKECGESVKQEYDDEDFKFCPHCGAQYIVKFKEVSNGKSKYLFRGEKFEEVE